MIEVEKLTKWYGPTLAVDGISFNVPAGEIIGFIGPNGAGKTTTMKILTTFIRPTSGKARVAGFDVTADPLSVRRRIGYLPEQNPLYVDMKVREYLAFMAELRSIPAADRKEATDRVVESCAIATVYEREIRELSKGFRQRVGLAQAMIHNPDILIMDEPTSGLDPNQIVEVRNLIREIGREKTVILSTHTLAEVALTCGRIIVIHMGALVADGTLEDLRRLSGLPDEASVTFTGGDGVKDALGKIPHVLGVKAGGGGSFELTVEAGASVEQELFSLASSSGWQVKSFDMRRTTLEKVFNALTMHKVKS